MGWIERPSEPCRHPQRPEARYGEQRNWECDICGERFRVESVDYGHDVMPGESSVGAYWITTALSAKQAVRSGEPYTEAEGLHLDPGMDMQ